MMYKREEKCAKHIQQINSWLGRLGRTTTCMGYCFDASELEYDNIRWVLNTPYGVIHVVLDERDSTQFYIEDGERVWGVSKKLRIHVLHVLREGKIASITFNGATVTSKWRFG